MIYVNNIGFLLNTRYAIKYLYLHFFEVILSYALKNIKLNKQTPPQKLHELI